MNRRSFLAGLGAALATVAATTRLGQSTIAVASAEGDMQGDFDPSCMRDSAEWFIKPEDDNGELKRFYHVAWFEGAPSDVWLHGKSSRTL